MKLKLIKLEPVSHVKRYSELRLPFESEYPELFFKLNELLDDHESYPETEKEKDIKRNPEIPCVPESTGGIPASAYVYGRR